MRLATSGWMCIYIGCLLPSLSHAQQSTAPTTKVYKTVGARQLEVDIFQPTGSEDGSKQRPAIAFFHGGGWVFGDRSVYHEACRQYAAKGFVTLTFEYRLSRNADGSYPHPEISPVESVKDARSAIRWIRSKAATLGVDTDRIAAWGRSAGGQLVWATALCEGIDEKTDNLAISPVPNAIVSISACYNTVQTWCERMLGDQRNRIFDISPHHRLKKGLPPAIGFHGKEDVTERIFVAYWFRDRALELENPFELVALDGEGHDLAQGESEIPGEFRNAAVLERADKFLREHRLMPVR